MPDGTSPSRNRICSRVARASCCIPCSNLLALLIEAVHLGRKLARQIEIIAEQTGDPEGHVVETAHRIEAWPQCKTEVGGGEATTIAARHIHQRLNAGATAPGPDPLQALMDQNAVVAIERHHVGDRAEGHQIEVIRHIGGSQPLPFVPAELTQMGVEGRHQVEGYPTPASDLEGKSQPCWFGLTMASASGSS